MTAAFGSTNAIVPGGNDVNPFAATAAPNNGSSAPPPTNNPNGLFQTSGSGANGASSVEQNTNFY